MDTKELAWLAGLLEGEGCFFDKCGAPGINVSMTDRDVVERAHRLLLGVGYVPKHGPRSNKVGIIRRREKSSYKTQYRARLSGGRAAGWMMTLYPLMGSRRRRKIREVLSIWRGRSMKHGRPSGRKDKTPRRKRA